MRRGIVPCLAVMTCIVAMASCTARVPVVDRAATQSAGPKPSPATTTVAPRRDASGVADAARQAQRDAASRAERPTAVGSVRRDCSSAIGTGDAAPSDMPDSIVAGPLSFGGLRLQATMGMQTLPDDPPGLFRPLKFPTTLSAPYSSVWMVIPQNQRGAVAFVYGPVPPSGLMTLDDGQHEVEFEACEGLSTQWNGGFVVAEPVCLRLLVHVERREAAPIEVPISFGADGCS